MNEETYFYFLCEAYYIQQVCKKEFERMNTMNQPTSRKVVFVTGAARGLGKAIAERFLAEGAYLVAFDLNEAELEQTANSWDVEANRFIVQSGDVRNRSNIQDAVQAAIEKWGRIDVLANVAGISSETHFLDINPAEWNDILDVNLTGVFNVAQIVAHQMVAQAEGGTIINMASKNGIVAEVKLGHYNATKAGVILLTKTMALDLADYSIRVNAVAPGYILTPMAEEIDSPEFMQFYGERLIPLNRLGKPEDVAGAFVFLSSDDCTIYNGPYPCYRWGAHQW